MVVVPSSYYVCMYMCCVWAFSFWVVAAGWFPVGLSVTRTKEEDVLLLLFRPCNLQRYCCLYRAERCLFGALFGGIIIIMNSNETTTQHTAILLDKPTAAQCIDCWWHHTILIDIN